MVERTPDDLDLDAIFQALALPIRRDILERVADGPENVGTLAEPHDVSLAAVSKHLHVLEEAGLMSIEKDGRVRRCHLVAAPLGAAFGWLIRYRVFWGDRLDALAIHLEEEPPMTRDTSSEASTADHGTRTLAVSRVIDAPPDRIYRAFLDPDELAEWMHPPGFEAEVHHLEPEEGGTFRMTFTGETDELADYGSTFEGTYIELVPGERIVHTDAFETDDPAMVGEITITVTFEAVESGTEVTIRQENIPDPIPVDDAHAGWTDSLDNLEQLPGSV